jgi:NADH-quinone oxidoreductase subunit E
MVYREKHVCVGEMPDTVTKAEIGHIVDDAIKKRREHDHRESALIAVLQKIQSEIGYLPREALEYVSEEMDLPISHVYGVATFFHQFRLRPKGKHVITVCSGTACHVQGSSSLTNTIRGTLKLRQGEDTSEDGIFTLVEVRCLGACGLAPVMKVDEEFYGNMRSADIAKVLNRYRRKAE